MITISSFGDPGFQYGIALSKTGGHAILNLADVDILPFEFNDFSETVKKYFDEITKLTDNMRKETNEQNKKLNDSDYIYASDPTQFTILQKKKALSLI